MARSRQNFLTGTVDDSPLLSGATLLTSTGLNSMNTITNPTTAVIVLDPQRVYGAQEIIFVTAHTSGQRTATVTRGQLGTTQRDHPTGTVWVQPMLVDDPAFLDQANSFSANNTFSAGLDITGSQSGFNGGELRFNVATSGVGAGISTVATGAPSMAFNHRGASNTGTFNWSNGTNGANNLMVLDGSGAITLYGSTVTFGSAGAGAAAAIISLATGSPTMYFQHKGTSNTGSFNWSNGTNGGTTLMSLSSASLLAVNGGVDIQGSPTGAYATGELRFPSTLNQTAGNGMGITTLATGSPRFYFDHRATGNTGDFVWRNGSGGITTLMTLSATGVLTVTGGTVQSSAGDLSLKATGSSSLFLVPAPGGNVAVTNGTYATTIGAAGGGSALPATPVKYWHVLLDGTTYSIPVYNP